jgi:hypothetical protein
MSLHQPILLQPLSLPLEPPGCHLGPCRAHLRLRNAQSFLLEHMLTAATWCSQPSPPAAVQLKEAVTIPGA